MNLRKQTWDVLEDLLKNHIEYKREPPPNGSRFHLIRDDESNFAQLNIYTYNPNTYKEGEMRHTRHEFIVPQATYHKQGWIRWVFDCIASIELHETTEHFLVRDESQCEVDCLCKNCGHRRTLHDGRYSLCVDCDCDEPSTDAHRFVCEDGHYTRIYGPHHSNGWSPYTFWPGHDIAEKKKAPGDA